MGGGGRERRRETERENESKRKICFRELAHGIVEASEATVRRGDSWLETQVKVPLSPQGVFRKNSLLFLIGQSFARKTFN